MPVHEGFRGESDLSMFDLNFYQITLRNPSLCAEPDGKRHLPFLLHFDDWHKTTTIPKIGNSEFLNS